MSKLDSHTSSILADWVNDKTRHLDLVAVWDEILWLYDDYFKFRDSLSDVERMKEFKQVVKDTNTYLTKVRGLLLSCSNLYALQEVLLKEMNTPTINNSRTSIAYLKLKQRWVIGCLSDIREAIDNEGKVDNE